MKSSALVLLILALAALALAQTPPRSHPAPRAPYLERHSALDKHPLKNDGGDLLCWADFGLQGRVRKMHIQTSDVIWEPGELPDHVIVRFDSLGRVHTTISYPHAPLPQGYLYQYRPDGQLLRVLRYAYQDGFATHTADLDSVFPAQGPASEYFYDELGYLSRVAVYDSRGQLEREYLYTYAADGYSLALNQAVPSRRHRDQLFFYDRQGLPLASQKKDLAGNFVITAKYSREPNRVTILQDYLNGAPTQTTTQLLDPAGRLKKTTVKDFRGNLMREYSYAYDDAGRLSREDYSSPNDRITTRHAYETDALGNLTGFSSSQGEDGLNFSLRVSYEYY